MFFFFGIVENRQDPEDAGRVQVRCFGVHSPDVTMIPTEDLPWATISSSLQDTDSPHDLVEGDMVWGFFVDAQEMQEPLICGCIQSNSGGNKNPQQGFSDRGVDVQSRPRKITAYTENGSVEGQPVNYSVGAYKQNLNSYSSSGASTLADQAKSFRVTIPLSGGSIKEPANPAARKYPYNKPKESESGHVIELDDTPGAERVHVFHRSGSFIEIHPDGTIVKKSIKDQYQITLGDSVQYSKGKSIVTNDGTFQHLSGLSYSIDVTSGDMNIDIKGGDLNMTVNGNMNTNVTGECVIKASRISLN